MNTRSYFLFLAILLSACTKQESNAPFTAPASVPGLQKASPITTAAPTLVTSRTTTSGGTIATGGGTVSARGVCYATSHNPTTANATISAGSGTGTFSCILNSLAGSTTYYARAYMVKSGVTSYGNETSFTTLTDYGTVTDADGNVYNTINIGGQVWMLENLKTTKYRNGVSIPNVTDNASWGSLTSGATCSYNNDEANVAIYGRLYNWYAATDVNNIAPSGWHLPSMADWDQLRNYLGGPDIAGGKVKETGYAHWGTPNSGADNSSGFTALPGGSRFVNYTSGTCSGATPVTFMDLGNYANWWTSSISSSNPDNALFISADKNSAFLYRSSFLGCVGYYHKATAYSIRLVRD